MHAKEICNADGASVMLPESPDRDIRIVASVGEKIDSIRGTTIPADSASGRVIATGEPVVLAGPQDAPGSSAAFMDDFGIAAAIIVPLRLNGQTSGALSVERQKGGRPFDPEDLRLLQSFATQASVALEYSDAQREVQRLAVYEDQERIARDLHDSVIQQLFAVGMSLQGVLRLVDDAPAAARIEQAVDDIDASIRSIRSTIFSLGQTARRAGLRADALAILSELSRTYDLQNRFEVRGLVDVNVGGDVADHLLATLREALSNVGRHAGATQVEVLIETTGDELVLRVRDNGVGMPERLERRSGLRNKSDRATRLDGRFTIGPGDDGTGTALEWAVAIRP
jgi:signal transduction histidine kinase